MRHIPNTDETRVIAEAMAHLDQVGPGGAVRVLEVRHVHVGARVEGIDHLPVTNHRC